MARNGSTCLQTASKWVQLGPNKSHWVQTGPIWSNGSGWVQISPNGSKQVKMGPNRSKQIENILNMSKLIQTDPNSPKMVEQFFFFLWVKIVQKVKNRPSLSKIIEIGIEWSNIILNDQKLSNRVYYNLTLSNMVKFYQQTHSNGSGITRSPSIVFIAVPVIYFLSH